MEKSFDFLESIVHFAPTLKELYSKDVAITISDREKVIYHLDSSTIKMEDFSGTQLKENEPMFQVMRSRKMIQMDIPVEMYGFAGKIVVAPLISPDNQVVGSIAIAASLEDQIKLMNVAKQFVSSTEQISASTEVLASSANHFKHYIDDLAASQLEMKQQVESTTKILEMINAVAKNTRILGFNAGIEAARSGEYGRGFSVVAKEITKLADKSAESVDEIRNLLNQLKDKVDEVATVVKNTVETETNQSTAIEEISQTLQGLTDVAEEIENMSKRI